MVQFSVIYNCSDYTISQARGVLINAGQANAATVSSVMNSCDLLCIFFDNLLEINKSVLN